MRALRLHATRTATSLFNLYEASMCQQLLVEEQQEMRVLCDRQ
jgi:hypothetical protein